VYENFIKFKKDPSDLRPQDDRERPIMSFRNQQRIAFFHFSPLTFLLHIKLC